MAPRHLSDGRRICVIGFHKTGTKSVRAALEALGYAVGNPVRRLNATLDPEAPDAAARVRRTVRRVLALHDAIEDMPGPFVFDVYDRAHPGSKFVLTTRPVEDWLASYRAFFGDANTPLRRWMYGLPGFEGHAEVYRAAYLRQHDRIRRHFRDRPGDLLEMDLGRGDGWHELVTFLGPEFLPPFPHRNANPARAAPA